MTWSGLQMPMDARLFTGLRNSTSRNGPRSIRRLISNLGMFVHTPILIGSAGAGVLNDRNVSEIIISVMSRPLFGPSIIAAYLCTA